MLLYDPLIPVMALAFADDAFANTLKDPDAIYQLTVPANADRLRLPWKDEWLNRPVFRAIEPSTQGMQVADEKTLSYSQERSHLMRLGRSVGLAKTLEWYDLRRGSGKKLNESLTPEERNKIMGHRQGDSNVYVQYYMSNFNDADCQSICFGSAPQHDLVHLAGRLLRHGDAPTALTNAQINEVNQDRTLQRCRRKRAAALDSIKARYGSRAAAEGTVLAARNGKITLTQFAYGNVPPYAILSHTWGKDEDEVKLQDIPGTAENKLGYTKIAFCADRAASDGFEYFWVDTCCIDKTSSAELQESINSMFRWYRDAAVCYVYLADVSTPAPDDSSSPPSWELTFRKSRWFTRGWTLQELIAPKSVEFFSKEGICLGTKMTLERHISEITGVPAIALRANRDLSSFTVDERTQRADFSVPFGLPTTAGVEMFVAREDELVKIHKTLQGDGSRRVVVLHGLGGIGKTQLAIAYAKRHRRDYSAVFWLNAKDKASLQQSFARVATQIQGAHPSASRLGSIDTEQDLDRVVDAVRAWLSLADNTRWLVVYDNYDNPKLRDNKDLEALDVRDFLPDSDQGSVIITTRVSRVENVFWVRAISH
ncbi:hypothetical protein SBRCBS47491_009953 [Sporothrix bragantina]|uniref:Heterokaryon incompatibility domain-containing protein n=1 Tax=Sporothrix bragantina TaxID=671064 RepID=A0ABP0CZ04_9PEZI